MVRAARPNNIYRFSFYLFQHLSLMWISTSPHNRILFHTKKEQKKENSRQQQQEKPNFLSKSNPNRYIAERHKEEKSAVNRLKCVYDKEKIPDVYWS